VWSNVQAHEPWLVPYLPHNGRGALDVGANVGHWSEDMAFIFEWVESYEPNPVAYGELEQRCLPYPNVHPIHSAVLDTAWPQEMHLFEDNAHTSFNLENFDALRSEPLGETITVASCQLDAVEFPVPLDFIKIDVEGAEVRALKGMRGTILKHESIVLVECHSAANLSDVQSLLTSLGHAPVHIPHPHNQPGHSWVISRPHGSS
jgi:FkbM family methyltransferase